MKLNHIQKTTLNPLRVNTNQEIVDKVNDLTNAVRELQNIFLEVNH